MKKFGFILFIAIALQICPAFGQKPKYRIENLKMEIDQEKLNVKYDLSGINTDAPVEVNLFFHDRDYRFIMPGATNPGPTVKVAPGMNNTINWDVADDIRFLPADFTPVLITGDPSYYKFGCGPASSLASLAIPGLGQYLVTDTKNHFIKPYMVTLAAYGLLFLGYDAKQDRYRDDPYLTNEGGVWKMGDWNYKYFPNDAEYLVSLGLAVWLADIIYVAVKGQQNKLLQKGMLRTLPAK